jgi:hypothetical protein
MFAGPTAGPDGEVPVVPDDYTYAAIGLGLGVVITRRLSTSPVMQPRSRARLGLAAMTFAALLGLLATTLGLQQGATQPALVFTLAGALFILRPPVLPPPTTRTSAR